MLAVSSASSILHDYPFCWRAEEDPLIQYPRKSWFILTTDAKDQMLANNSKINWLPGHIRDGRFGKFLESNVDWALSRERYWGTPLPIWVCEETGKMEALGSYEELLAKPGVAGTDVWEEAKSSNPELPDDLCVHKPYIDAVTYDSPLPLDQKMQRVTEVIDCWYDSGAMPFAQWGFRGQASGTEREHFLSQFPADFISEAIDQTRGWFYSQVAISTLLFGQGSQTDSTKSLGSLPSYPHPFKNCIVLGLMLGEDGQKMSKSKRNYRDPSEIFDLYGADALRWYLFANQPPWTSIQYREQAIKDSIPEFLLRLWNVYSFFTIYANIDEFDPSSELQSQTSNGMLDACDLAQAKTYRPIEARGELDRWILGELSATAAKVVESMDAYDNFAACEALTEFVDALSNWYVRRSRDRFWASDKRATEKLDAYWTLYECLLTTSKLIAPFVPFLAESLWQKLAVACFGERVPESVHLCDYPTGDASVVDEVLSTRMNLVRHISSLGRQARNDAQLKVRQPLSKVEVVLADNSHQAWLEQHAEVIADELNVKQINYSDEPDKYVEHEILPNFKLLGPKLGKLMPKLKKVLNEQSGAELLQNLRDNGIINTVVEGQEVELLPEEIEVRIKAREGWSAANAKGVVVVLATELTPELLAEGLARDWVRVLQDQRKELGCDFTDKIEISVTTESTELASAVNGFRDYILSETLANSISLESSDGANPEKVVVGGHDALVSVRVVSSDRPPLKVAVLISGGGRTLKNFIDLVNDDNLPLDIRLVISSSKKAGGLEFAEKATIPSRVVSRSDYSNSEDYGEAVFSSCREAGAELVVMAGFLKLVSIPSDFEGKVVNIHPSLIPSFCGHGMYGHRVHQAVVDYGAKITGCTIHFVDNQYDAGPIIWQQPVPVFDDDTAETLANRVFEAEKEAYPHVLRLLAAGKIKLEGRRVTISAR